MSADPVTRTREPGPDPVVEPRSPAVAGRGGRRAHRFRRDRVLLLMAVPTVAVYLVFHYVPILGNVIAFKDYQPYIGILDSAWSGLENFAVIVEGDAAFLTALRNTLIFLVLQCVFVFPAPIVLALLLNSVSTERVKRVVQSVLYMPHFLSWVIVVAIFQQFLGDYGVLNNALRDVGAAPLDLIGNADAFRALVTSQVIWKDTGWGTIIFLAALAAIPEEQYESAAVDGAGPWRRTWHITLPGLRGLIVLLLILRLGDALTVGFEQLLLQRSQVGPEVAEVLDTYVYFNGVLGGDWGTSAAVGLVKGVLGVVLVLAANRLAHVFGERGVYSTR